MSEVSYTQTDDLTMPGQITLDGETVDASGRLDAIGDVVFATFGDFVTVVCERDAVDTMRITIQFADLDEPYYYAGYTGRGQEAVLTAVPLNFS